MSALQKSLEASKITSTIKNLARDVDAILFKEETRSAEEIERWSSTSKFLWMAVHYSALNESAGWQEHGDKDLQDLAKEVSIDALNLALER